ncbi:MAG: excinuclease ABC subunit UvrA [Tannerella sp.]|jgi:excinuclease UvrABC ATPase subunit|nr:excinuclease ABC subunit UvrA [Tannerella sp.]
MEKKSHDHIIIRSATLNNLKSVSLKIPRNWIIVFAGVSGSGKSSVVFDTIAVESQRQLNETFSWYIRNRLPKYQKPEVVSIENLSPAIIVDQKRMGGNSRSTVGTITDIQPLLRLLFSRIGQPSAGESNHYSFNDPAGMCPVCKGLGKVVSLDMGRFIDMDKSLNEGAVLFPTFRIGSYYMNLYANTGLFDMNKPLKNYTGEELRIFLYGADIDTLQRFAQTRKTEWKQYNDFEGVASRFNRLYLNRDLTALNDKRTDALMKFMKQCICPECKGKRLNKAALSSKINGYSIADFSEMEMDELRSSLSRINDSVGSQVARILTENIGRIINIGLGYLHLDRETPSLSGGESQRLKIVKHLGSSLTGMTYIFDEPSIGLHPRDITMLNNLFTELRDKGNTVIIVEHDKDIIRHADTVIEMGPLAGENGGEVIFNGNVEQFLTSDTLTANMLNSNIAINKNPCSPAGWLPVKNASLHNLKNISVRIPEGVLTCITGVAGSGKSSLSQVFTKQYPDSVTVSQSSITTSIRSTPVTYLGIMDAIRKIYADTHQVSPGLFSFNSEGACPVCKGKGVIETDMAFMDTVTTVCEHCGGKRFAPEIMKYKIKGKSITDILSLTIKQSIGFFEGEKFIPKLKSLYNVGLGYITLGQSLDTLSGGELQRVKLANELKKSGKIYVMDEPTTGLHMADVAILMDLLRRMVKNGNSIMVIEHNLDVIKQADWIIDIGPDGGKNGGRVIFEGTPLDLLQASGSVTAEYLRRDIV